MERTMERPTRKPPPNSAGAECVLRVRKVAEGRIAAQAPQMAALRRRGERVLMALL